jgi:WD40 repeat protein
MFLISPCASVTATESAKTSCPKKPGVREHLNFTQAIFSPDEQYVLAVWRFNALNLYETNSGNLRYAIPVVGTAYYIAFSPDGKQFVAGLENRVILYDTETGKQLRTYKTSRTKEFEYDGTRASFTPDGKFLLTSGWQGAALWDVENAARIHIYKGDMRTNGGHIEISASEKYVVTMDEDFMLWEIATGRLVKRFPKLPCFCQPAGATLSPDGTMLITNDGRGLVVWNIATFRMIYILDTRQTYRKWAVSPDSRIITVFADNTPSAPYILDAKIWLLKDGKPLKPLSDFSIFDPIIYSPDSSYLYLVNHTQGESHNPTYINVWKLLEGRVETTFSMDQWYLLENPVFTRDGKRWLILDQNGHLYLRDARTGVKLIEYC